MTEVLRLPGEDGAIRPYTLGEPRASGAFELPLKSRVVYAAAHVVADPLAANFPGAPAKLDWGATLAYRRHLWSLGLGVAEAMDTAQRGMGLDWPTTRELIRRSVAEARAVGGRVACGAGTDHLAGGRAYTLSQVVEAYRTQCAFVEEQGGRIILMASRALAAAARGPDDYARVYQQVLSQVEGPVILHWLGEMFDPALAGYWGHSDPDQATRVCLRIIQEHESKIEGLKVSLLDRKREIDLRRRLPASVRMYTGDDFNYPELIRGDAQGFSHALLGIFDAIAPAAAAAVAALDRDDLEAYDRLLAPTVDLARHIFQKPTYHYKTGIVFMAYLNGLQDHFRMVGGLEAGRSVPHLAKLLILADRAGLLRAPELAARRMRRFLALAGIEQTTRPREGRG